MPFVVTSCAFKIHRASGRGRGKPVLICILACSLAITFERRSYIKISFFNDATKLLSLLSLEKVETETWERDKVNGVTPDIGRCTSLDIMRCEKNTRKIC